MSDKQRRLEKVSSSLSPREAVLLWMQEAHQHGSLRAYAHWLKEQPASAYPLVRLPRMVRGAVQDAARGERREVMERLVMQAERELIFLFKLQLKANTYVALEHQAMLLAHLLMLQMLRWVFDQNKSMMKRAATWREMALSLAGQAYLVGVVTERVAQRYFAGQSILFPEAAQELAETLGEWDSLLERYNDLLEALGVRGWRRYQLQPADVRASIEEGTKTKTAFVVDWAKAETLQRLGEYEAAGRLVER